MPLVTIQNLLSSKVTVPSPVDRILGPKRSIQMSLTYSQLESNAFADAVMKGIISVTVAADPGVPDVLEVPTFDSLTNVVRLEDDFLCDSFPGQSNWTAAGLGGAVVAAVTASTVLAGAAGVIGMAVTTNASAALYRQGMASVSLGFGALSTEMRTRLSTTLPTVDENFTVKLGMGNQTAANGAPTIGVGLLLDTSISPSFWVAERAFGGSTIQQITTIPVVAGAWIRIRFAIDKDGNRCTILFDDVPVWDVDLSDVVKDEATVRFGPYWQIIKTAGTLQRNLFIDYISMTKVINRV